MEYPLGRHNFLRSNNLEEMQDVLGRIMCPHRLSYLDKPEPLDAVINSFDLGNLVLNYVQYGVPIAVDPGATGDFYALQIPLYGNALVRSGGKTIISTPEIMAVTDPEAPLYMELERSTKLLLVRADWDFANRVLRDLTGGLLPWKLRFDLGLDVSAGRQCQWFTEVVNLVRRADVGGGMLKGPMWVPQLEESMVARLIQLHAHRYSELLATPAMPASQRVFGQVVDKIEAMPEQLHTEGSLASEFDVSSRSLRSAFQRYLETSLFGKLWHVRLHRAHLDLLWATPEETTVPAVAERWGLWEPLFTQRYGENYGETPEQTLRR
ncbi:AraC family transcriptional regulator [Amycolatopsis acidicola]|nr:AraC family transcriptional regulator [Amycolatopsis acidicola]